MTKEEYFLKILTSDVIYLLKWYYSLFSIPIRDNYENDFLKLENNKYLVKYNNTWIELTDVKYDKQPVLKMTDVITLEPNTLTNQNEVVKTTIGIAIVNKLLLADTFNTSILYINNSISIKMLEKIIVKLLQEEKITVDSYIKYVNATLFFRGLSRLVTVASSYKAIMPPPKIKEYKATVNKEMIEKYGVNWTKDRALVIEFENKLKAYDDAWLKDDPTYGKAVSGKVKNDARPKQFLTFGAESGFDETGTIVNLVENSLEEGYPKDIKLLAAMYNSSRAGSFYRGAETQKGGSAAKDSLRATSGITIIEGDCGTTIGKSILVTSSMSENLNGRYLIENKKPVRIDNPVSLIGKTIELRSPQYCKADGGHICAVCVGDLMSKYPNGIPLLITAVGNVLLTSSLKKMHKSNKSNIAFDIRKVLK